MVALKTIGEIELNWNEDEELLNSLDKLMNNCREDLDEFLTHLWKYNTEIGLVGQAMLFGGVGKLVTHYLITKENNQSIEESLALSFQAVNNDRRVQALMGHAMEKAVDDKVAQMKGE